QAMAYGDTMTLGNYTLICRSYTQDDGPNSFNEWALLDIQQNGKIIGQLAPQRIFYKASRQASTKPDIWTTFKEDVYVVYEGQNENGQPILKVHLNPLVVWIWIGAIIIVAGTALALVENAPAPVTVRVPKGLDKAVPVAGD